MRAKVDLLHPFATMDRLDGLLSKLREIDLSGTIVDVKPVLKGFGASCDVFVGFCLPIRKRVAVKRLRVFMSREEEFAKRLFKELYIWSKLDHPNVLPLVGYFIEDEDLPNLVSEWMEHGTLHDFMKNIVSHGNKLAMIIGIASGLCHLHLHEVIHADLKSHNVLISSTGEPLLTDFGVSHILACSLSTAGGTTSNLSSPKGTVRWMAKELFQSDEFTDPQPHNKMSDVWAFGMVVYELLSHESPYPHLKTDMQVMFAISTGKLPPRPSKTVDDGSYDVDDELWKLCNLCWNPEPSARPTVENIIIFVNEVQMQHSEAEEWAARRNSSFPAFQPLPQFATPRVRRPSGANNRLDNVPTTGITSMRVRNGPRRPLPRPPMTSNKQALDEETHTPKLDRNGQDNIGPDNRARSGSRTDRPPLVLNTDLPPPSGMGRKSRTTPSRKHPHRRTPSSPDGQPSGSHGSPPLVNVVTPVTPPLNIKKKRSANLSSHPLYDISRTPTPHTPRTKLRKELLDFRPLANRIYDTLDDFFPDHDLDKPLASASTPTDSPTAVDADVPEFRSFPTRADNKVRRSIRVVAAEQQRRLSDPNVFLQPSIFERYYSPERSSARPDNGSFRTPEGDGSRSFNWVRGQPIGRGTNSHIFLALNARSGELFAVKGAELPQTHHDDSRQANVVNAMRRESGILKTVCHQNIVKYIGQEETSDYFHIFLEYVPGGNIAGCLRRHGKFEDQTIRSFTGQILAALEHIHDRGIIHCELKSDNILIDPSGVCKLCDFGLARRITGSTEPVSSIASPSSWQMAIWVAPEIMRAAKNSEQYVYDVKADIWGLGCVVLEMVAGKQPWGDAVIFELIDDRKMLPAVPADIELSPDVDDFRRKCLSNHPNDRLTAAKLLRHPYLVLRRDWVFRGFS